MNSFLAVLVGLLLLGGWALKVVAQTIVQREYDGWGPALARCLISVAGRFWRSRKTEWDGELAAIQSDGDGTGILYALEVFAGSARHATLRGCIRVPVTALAAFMTVFFLPLMVLLAIFVRIAGGRPPKLVRLSKSEVAVVEHRRPSWVQKKKEGDLSLEFWGLCVTGATLRAVVLGRYPARALLREPHLGVRLSWHQLVIVTRRRR